MGSYVLYMIGMHTEGVAIADNHFKVISNFFDSQSSLLSVLQSQACTHAHKLRESPDYIIHLTFDPWTSVDNYRVLSMKLICGHLYIPFYVFRSSFLQNFAILMLTLDAVGAIFHRTSLIGHLGDVRGLSMVAVREIQTGSQISRLVFNDAIETVSSSGSIIMSSYL